MQIIQLKTYLRSGRCTQCQRCSENYWPQLRLHQHTGSHVCFHCWSHIVEWDRGHSR
uniref:C2H2-type domain-containing protein n=1 Tax=Anguilla anguilla TaxID=7936 RepID=A0A0E9QSB1_ANGAN